MEQNLETKKVIDKKQMWRNIAIIGGALVLGQIPGAIIASVILAKKGKLKLQKVPKAGKITKVQTGETKIIEEYNQKLELKIREILSKPLLKDQDNYELQIAQLKYENQMEMLEQQIKFRLNQPQKKGHKAYNYLSIKSLQDQHKQIAEKLQLIYKHKGQISTNNSEKDKLTNLYENIKENQEKLGTINNQIHQRQKPILEAIEERKKQLAHAKDEKEIHRLKEEINLLTSYLDKMIVPSEKIDSSNLRIQIELLNKQKQGLIEQMVSKTDSIAKAQWKKADDIEQKSR